MSYDTMSLYPNHVAVYYDIEFVGDLNESISHCRVYELAATRDDGAEFHTLVNPGRPFTEPVVGRLPPRSALECAPALQEAVDALMVWVGQPCVLVSHGNFRSDQLVLRAARFPRGTLFADSLMIARSMVRVPRYTLGFLHSHFKCGAIASPHCALDDARALRRVMHALRRLGDISQHMCVYGAHDYALSNYAGIGAKTELALARGGYVLADPRTWESALATLSSYMIPHVRALQAHVAETRAP